MKQILLWLLALASILSFASSNLGIESKICQGSRDVVAAKIDLYSKTNFESSEYIKLENSDTPSDDELESRLRKIEEAHDLIAAMNKFCKD